jgi:oxygen-independent coproporphyrinogen-3 oxidase
MIVSKKLIEKYNVPVPRYTSYPPANYFHENFGEEDYVAAIEQSNSEWPNNISIYIHIPFCTKLCHFCGCNSHVSRDRNKMSIYVDAVKKEILRVKAMLDPQRKVSQVHWGGGTPNSLDSGLIREIMDVIHANFSFIENPEIAIECHPALLDEKLVSELVQAGFNRFSLGVQDFKKEVLDNVNREAPAVPVSEIVKWIRSYDNTGINLDFIYGLPFQDVKSFSETIEKAVEISPDRLVTFSYAHVPWIKKAQKILEKRGLPKADEKLKMFEAGYKILTENGYTAIGLDHFAKEGDELSVALKNRKLHRNFQGYCTRETTGQVYAFGSTGISQLESIYAQNGKDTNRYIENIESGRFNITKGYRLNRQEKIIRHVITEIMCNEYVSMEETARFFNVSTGEVNKALQLDMNNFSEFINDGLLEVEGGSIFKVSSAGRFFIRNIAANFDPNLKSANKRFSKAL